MTHSDAYLKKRRKFEVFDAYNPHIYERFETLSAQARSKVGRLSPWLVVNMIRWEAMMAGRGGEAEKISNDFIAFYARKLMASDPSTFAGFFIIKQMQGEDLDQTKRECGIPVK
jgi:hypothetical protein